MESKALNSLFRILTLVFCFALLIPFQNCAVYESDGRKVFESTLDALENKGCYPYIDTNIAMELIGAVDGSLNVYKVKVANENAHVCDFITTNASLDHINHINCKVSAGSAEQAIILKQDGEAAFTGIVSGSIWPGQARSGFQGDTRSGYVSFETDGKYTIRYLAVETNEQKGVSCSVRMTSGYYDDTTKRSAVKSALVQIAQEMAIGNKE